MPKKVSEQTKQEALALRSAGMSYGEISEQLNVSVSWCKLNLVSSQEKKKEVIKELEAKSKSKRGVSKGEIAKAVNTNQSKDALKKEIKNMSQRIRTRSKENIVRPNWMMPEFSMFVTDQVMLYANEMERRLQEQAEDIRISLLNSCTTKEQQEDVPSTLQLKFAIAQLVCTMVNPTSIAGGILTNTTHSLYDSAIKLEKRNGDPSIGVKVQPMQVLTETDDLDEVAY